MAIEVLYEQGELERIFRDSVDEWERDTGAVSSVTTMVLHPAYQRIIGLGRQALPLIFDEMRERPGHWFWALRAITGEDPVPPGSGFGGATDVWLNWAREHGYTD